MLKFIATARKAVVPVVAGVAQAVELGLLHGTALYVASAVLWLAAAAGVYRIPNADKPPVAQKPTA